ncbi:hypothetical protein DE146DRAFT_761311 [Phaeosphaeria sp. MPI-PUGE-AT-0046c]|nr:hypothetical protein DE146DRAFT_761311 [Phaeosphaeria sp. MPI-PUGE-AT-0046c]
MPTLLSFLALLSLLFTTIVTCGPIKSHGTHQRRQNGEGVVSGIEWRDNQSSVPVRREVRDLRDNYPEQWNLYLLALTDLQWADQSDPLSYYSLASKLIAEIEERISTSRTGIHGRPFRTWGNAPGLEHKIGTAGYCPHSNSLFLSWHRPYLTIFEEQLYRSAQYWASTAAADQRDRYTAAARSFRMPYWDWARGEEGGTVPEFFTTEEITVSRPNGSTDSMWNPLYTYHFNPLVPEGFNDKWALAQTTLRWPDSDASTAVSRQGEMFKSFEGQRRGLRDHIDAAFRQPSMNAFANTVEEAHGWIHGVIGGGWDGKSAQGHMWPLEYSAFEPLFMLHHANVDRLFAMYQAAHPDVYFTPEIIGRNGNVFLEDGQTVDADTPLLPFRHPAGGFWTANSARSTETFGYVYPETMGAGSEDEPESDESRVGNSSASLRQKQRVQEAIAQLYGSSARAMLSSHAATAGATLLGLNGAFTDWTIRIDARAQGLPSTFVVRFELVEDAPGEGADVGSWVRAMPEMQHLRNDTKEQGSGEKEYQGRVGLTSSLLDQIGTGKLKSLEPRDVEPYLKKNLRWDVIGGKGASLPSTDLAALSIEVICTSARIPNDNSKPIEYDTEETAHPQITMGKAGGVVMGLN